MSVATTSASSPAAPAANLEVRNGYAVPKWAGKPPNGLHLDVMKEGKLVQKLMIDEQRCYFFGRNKDVCDFTIDHASCSRVHAVLLWHKDLNRSFIVDLGSAHGTFIGRVQLEGHKPQQVFVDSELHFGASTRSYIIREKPQMKQPAAAERQQSATSNNNNNDGDYAMDEDAPMERNGTKQLGLFPSLPQSEAELDNLTEFNTAHNRRIAQLVDMSAAAAATSNPSGPKKKRKAIAFTEEEVIINPEDVDPSVGRFRNLISTTVVIPNKKKKGLLPSPAQQTSKRKLDEDDEMDEDEDNGTNTKPDESFSTLYDDEFESSFTGHNSVASNLGIRMLDLAPDVDSAAASSSSSSEEQRKRQLELLGRQHLQRLQQQQQQFIIDEESHKKKYIKEAWPGRKPSAGPADFASQLATSPPATKLPSQFSFSNPPPMIKRPQQQALPSETTHNPAPPSASLAPAVNPTKRLII